MQAIVMEAGGVFAVRDVPPPEPKPSEALVRVEAISLNRGEATRALSARVGTRPGWDLAGVVERQAADGSGPAAGTRVAGLLASGAWSELAAVPVRQLAAIPDGVATEQAACLPVAGLTALYALKRGGDLLGKRVLVTGATGGVGHFACQLARQAGARVTAMVRTAEDVPRALGFGAHHAAVMAEDQGEAASIGPFDLIVESVGGPSLARSLGMLAPGGLCVVFGVTGGPETTIDARAFYMSGSRTVTGLAVFEEIKSGEPAARGLSLLLALAAEGRLAAEIAVRRPWAEMPAAAADLLARRHKGKTVLLVQDGGR